MLFQKFSLSSILAIILMGCAPPIVGDATSDMDHGAVDMATPIDQQPSQPPCPAAAGISGDVFLCTDFSRIRSLSDPALGNWNFQATATDCWQIVDDVLSNKDVQNLNWACAVSLPAFDLTAPTVEKYNRIMLSINYKLDLRSSQRVDIFLTANDLIPRSEGWVFMHTGSDEQPRNLLRSSTVSIEKNQLPGYLNKVFKPYIRLISSYKDIVSQGWQISSVAIIGATE